MKPASPINPIAPASESEKAALLTLLSDEDEIVYSRVRDRILSLGATALQWLEPCRISNDHVLRHRALELFHTITSQAADNVFLAFCLNQGEEFSIEDACFALAKTQYPSINIAGYQALLDDYASNIEDQLRARERIEGVLAAINQHLFHELKFRPNEEDYYDPDNSYLNRVMDRRTGNPISLCMIYLLIARRFQLPVVGIGMPGHFLLRCQTSKAEIYIDAFHQGKLLTKADCIKYLVQTSGFQEAYLAPVSPRRILLRICSNLHQIYLQRHAPDQTARLQRYIIALAK